MAIRRLRCRGLLAEGSVGRDEVRRRGLLESGHDTCRESSGGPGGYARAVHPRNLIMDARHSASRVHGCEANDVWRRVQDADGMQSHLH